MLYSKLSALSTAVLLGVAAAQGPTANYTDAQIQQAIKGQDNAGTTTSWCISEKTVCGNLCSGSVTDGGNECDAGTLKYTCTCAANNSAPGLQFYQNSIPSYICEFLLGDCLKTNAGDAASQEKCKKDFVCGKGNATSPVAAAPTTSLATSATPSASAAPSSSSKAAAAFVAAGEQFGTGILGAGFLAIMGYLL